MIKKIVGFGFIFGFGVLCASADAAPFKELFAGGRCDQALEQKEKEHQQLTQENHSLRDTNQQLTSRLEEIQKQNSQMIETCRDIDSDKENLMLQSERLRRENEEFRAAKEAYDGLLEEKNALLQAKAALEKHITELQEQSAAMETRAQDNIAEKTELQQKLEEATERQRPYLNRIKDEYQDKLSKISELLRQKEDENKALAGDLKETRKAAEVLERDKFKWEQQASLLQGKLDELNSQFKELQKENIALAEESRTFPRRFAELARQNERLIKETADMHYNLGVFYVKNKEHKRAVHEFEKVLDLKPKDAQAIYNLGYIYAQHLVDRPRAIRYFEDYLSYAPDARDADWVRKYLLTWQTWYGKEVLQ
jgi:chromosome segregation ATPase